MSIIGKNLIKNRTNYRTESMFSFQLLLVFIYLYVVYFMLIDTYTHIYIYMYVRMEKRGEKKVFFFLANA